ncbi:hypothetical protein EDB85DRAFT_2152818 [Lactarius pseudohatsudake]|nr:hypothetical protein EDB85DRAFT_2152818 [Lactarius pseudohatsudake]
MTGRLPPAPPNGAADSSSSSLRPGSGHERLKSSYPATAVDSSHSALQPNKTGNKSMVRQRLHTNQRVTNHIPPRDICLDLTSGVGVISNPFPMRQHFSLGRSPSYSLLAIILVLDTNILLSSFTPLIEGLVNRTVDPCKKALNDAGVKVSEINEVILSRQGHRVYVVIVIGTSIQGRVLTGNVTDILLLDITPLSLGARIMTKLISRNTPIPTKKSFRPLQMVKVLLSNFKLVGIPPKGVPQIEITFDHILCLYQLLAVSKSYCIPFLNKHIRFWNEQPGNMLSGLDSGS